MTLVRVRRLFFFLALLLVPVPFYLGEPELSPVVRLVFLSALMGAVWLAEGGWTTGTLFALGASQALVYAALLWLGAWCASRALGWLRVPAARAAVVAVITLGMFAASLTPIYGTGLSSKRPRSNVFQLFE